MPDPTALIFGPAYLDRVLRVDRRLGDPPLDASVDGRSRTSTGEGLELELELVDPGANRIGIKLPEGWPGPWGSIELSRSLSRNQAFRWVEGVAWHDDLGGMGAGYAASMGGTLVSALGPESDPASVEVAGLLRSFAIDHRPIRVDHPSDWTLLVTSGAHGDKLPIGFRGCHASLSHLEPWVAQGSRLRVVAALPNRLARQALSSGLATIRVFAPNLRNMTDRDPPIASFARSIDVLSCNRGEWETLADQDQAELSRSVAILIVTDGPRGAWMRFTNTARQVDQRQIAAFPRSHPPTDTNRAGEAFTSTLLTTLLEAQWLPGPLECSLAERALERASAAAALVLDRSRFGFPSAREIDDAWKVGKVLG